MAHKVLSRVALRDWIQQKKKKKSNWNLQPLSTLRFLDGGLLFRISLLGFFQQPIISNQLASPMSFLTQAFVFTPVWDWRHKEDAGLRPLQAVVYSEGLAGNRTQHLSGRTLSRSFDFGSGWVII